MRIAIFTESFLPKWDGVSTTLCHLLEHLADRGHASLMFAPRGAPKRYAETEIVGLPSFPCPRYPELKLVPPFVNVKRQVAAFEPDLVHLVNPFLLGRVGLRHCRALGLPVVASYHTDLPGYAILYGLDFLHDPLYNYMRRLHNQADLNLCPSHFTKRDLERHGYQRLAVWGRGVDTVHFRPNQRSDEWRRTLSGGRPEAPLLLYVGRLASEKRVDWLYPVLQALPEARLALVGDGPIRPALEELFAGTRTVFTGYLKGKALASAYASADIFCFPSPTETFGNVVLEAMASGLPVIVPRAGGPVDHVINDRNGFLFEPDDPEDLISKTRTLVNDLKYARKLGKGARAYAESQTWEAILDGLLDDYAKIANSDAARQSRVPEPFAWVNSLLQN